MTPDPAPAPDPYPPMAPVLVRVEAEGYIPVIIVNGVMEVSDRSE